MRDSRHADDQDIPEAATVKRVASALTGMQSKTFTSVAGASPWFDFAGQVARIGKVWGKQSQLFSGLAAASDSVASLGGMVQGLDVESLGGIKRASDLLAGQITTKQMFPHSLLGSATSASLAGVINSTDLFKTSTSGIAGVLEQMSDLRSSSVLNHRVASAVSELNKRPWVFEGFQPPSIGLIPSLDWITEVTRNVVFSRAHLPPNWRHVYIDPEDAEDDVRQILEEGLPLAWVPSSRVTELLLEADGAPARRRVISRNYRGILTDCDRVLSQLPSRKALTYADMARRAIKALRDGHVEAAQSLATNVFDTVVTQHSQQALGLSPGALKNPSSYVRMRKQGWRIALAVHPVTTIMRGNFTVNDRPQGLRRNATAHAITRHQYNRINAVIAIMNATALISCFVRDTPAFDS